MALGRKELKCRFRLEGTRLILTRSARGIPDELVWVLAALKFRHPFHFYAVTLCKVMPSPMPPLLVVKISSTP